MTLNDAIGVKIEADFELRHTSGSHWETNDREVSKQLVLACNFTLSLVDRERDSCLVVIHGGILL